jgi:hypothetical protein
VTLRSRIRDSASEALRRIPSRDNLADRAYYEKRMLFLRQVRDLLGECARAEEWDDEQLRLFALQTESIRLSFDACLEMVPEPVEVGGEMPCTLRCASEREECVRSECGEVGPRFPVLLLRPLQHLLAGVFGRRMHAGR